MKCNHCGNEHANPFGVIIHGKEYCNKFCYIKEQDKQELKLFSQARKGGTP